MSLKIQSDKGFALIIGNWQYPGFSRHKTFRDAVRNDCLQLLLMLKEKNINYKFLENVNLPEIQQAIRQIQNTIETPKFIFTYFSGHGSLCFRKINYKIDDVFTTVQEIDDCIICNNGDSLAISNIIDEFDSLHAKNLQNIPKIFIFDCCRGDDDNSVLCKPGPAAAAAGSMATNFTSVKTDILIAFSTIRGSYALADKRLAHSVFTYYFIQEFKNNSKDIDIGLKNVEEKIRSYRLGKLSQTPEIRRISFPKN
ncbi:caspase-5-like isoform a, partial [Dinothrombium tinctorium]